MEMKEQLQRRKWPTRPERVKYSSDLYVCEGRMFNRALQMEQDLSEPIPPGECAITSLASGPDGSVFGATSGARSHLFRYSWKPPQDGVHDLGVIEGARAVRQALGVGADGTVLGGISEAADGNKEGGLFRASHREIELLPAPVPGECVAALVVDRDRGVAYGLSSETGMLFSVAIGSGNVSVKGKATEAGGFSHVLVLDAEGNVYGAGPSGRLFRFDPSRDAIEELPLSLPTVAGRGYYNRMDSAALDPSSGLIYGGGSADGVIFVLDPEQLTIRSLGKVLAEPGCRAIAVAPDGRVYGVAGESDGMGHLFCYDPDVQELRDLGIPYAASERTWHGYEFGAACTGANGEIYLGESDRVSHLFIYFPPVRPTKTSSDGEHQQVGSGLRGTQAPPKLGG